MRSSTRRGIGEVAAAIACAALAAPASAQCPGAAVITLSDSAGFTWDLDATGAVVGGSAGAFDGLYALTVGGVPYVPAAAATLDMGGRQAVYPATLVVGPNVMVARRVYVPAGEAWARWVDEYVNFGATARTFMVEIRTNSGADDMLEVVETSDGDTTLEAVDRTFVLDNELTMPPPPEMPMETPPPASCHVVWGAGATTSPSAISSGASFTCRGVEGATIRYSLSLPAFTTARLVYFAAQADTRAEASAACATLATLPASTFADLSGMARMEILNWPVARPLGTACSSAAACSSGHCVDGVCCDTACGGGAPGDCEACADAAGSTAPDGTCGVARSTHTCRPEASLCDRLERCDGTARTCPPDVVRPAGTMCRPAATRSCDVPEACDGSSPLCPTDRFLSAGTVCDPLGSIPCFGGGVCTGVDPGCPRVREAPDRTPCDDMVACTEAWCVGGACLRAGSACDDGDGCTDDSCPDAVTCAHVPMAGCDGGLPPIPDAGPPEFEDTGPTPGDDGSADLDAGAGDLDAAGDLDGGGGRMDARVRRDGDPLTPADLSLGGGGCACRVARGSARGSLFALALALALGARVRRRPRRRSLEFRAQGT